MIFHPGQRKQLVRPMLQTSAVAFVVEYWAGVAHPHSILFNIDKNTRIEIIAAFDPGMVWRSYLMAWAAACAAAGRASAIFCIVSSSWAAETNQASNTDGARYTPPSSMAWKKGP